MSIVRGRWVGAPPPLGSPHMIVPMRAQRGRRPPGTSDDRRPDDPRCRRPHVRAPPGAARHRRAAPRLSWKTTAEPGWTQAAYELEVRRGDEVWESGRPSRPTSRCSCRGPTRRSPPASAPGPRARDRRRREPLGVERARGRRGRAARAVRLGRPRRRRGLGGGPRVRRAPAAAAAPRVRRTRRPRRGAPLRHRARGLRGRDQRRAASATTRSSPGWTVYGHRLRYYTYDVTDAARRRRERDRRAGSATAGTAAASAGTAGSATSSAHDLSLLAQLELRYADGTIETVATDDSWRAAPGRSCAPASTTARPTTPARSRRAGRAPGYDDADWHRVVAADRDPRRSSRPRGRRCAAPRRSRRSRCSRTPSGRRVARLRPEPRRPPAHPRVRGRPAIASVIRTAEVLQDGELCTRPLRDGDVHRRVRAAPAASVEEWEPRFTFHGFRYAEVDRLARRPRRRRRERRPRGARVPHRPRAHRLVRVLRPARRTPARERRLEHARQLPRRPHRLPAARRAPRLDRRHPGVRADRVVPLRRVGHALLVAARRRGRAAPDGTVPWYVPRDPARTRMWTPITARRRLGRRRGARPVDALRALRRRGHPRRAVRQREGVGRPRRAARRRPTGCGTRASSSATGSTRPRRRRTRPTRRTDRYLVATAYFARSAEHLARMRRGARPRATTPSATRDARRRGARGVRRATTCCPTGA